MEGKLNNILYFLIIAIILGSLLTVVTCAEETDVFNIDEEFTLNSSLQQIKNQTENIEDISINETSENTSSDLLPLNETNVSSLTVIEVTYTENISILNVSIYENEVPEQYSNTIGVYDNKGTWALWNANTNLAKVVGFGWANTQPVEGDWDGDKVTEVGIYNSAGNNFFIQKDSGPEVIGLGWSGVTPVVGDWNGDGKDEVGVYDNKGTWALWNTGKKAADIVGFGWAGTKPIVGDWDGDGATEVGIYNTAGNNFMLKADTGFEVIGLGWSEVTPVVGDWNGDGKDEVGVYDNKGTWALWNTDKKSADTIGFGWAGTQPVVGDWDQDGRTEVGIYNTGRNNFLLQKDSGFNVIGLGWSGVIPCAGNWG